MTSRRRSDGVRAGARDPSSRATATRIKDDPRTRARAPDPAAQGAIGEITARGPRPRLHFGALDGAPREREIALEGENVFS